MFSINDGVVTDELNDGGFMAKHTQLLSVQLLFSENMILVYYPVNTNHIIIYSPDDHRPKFVMVQL